MRPKVSPQCSHGKRGRSSAGPGEGEALVAALMKLGPVVGRDWYGTIAGVGGLGLCVGIWVDAGGRAWNARVSCLIMCV